MSSFMLDVFVKRKLLLPATGSPVEHSQETFDLSLLGVYIWL